VPAAGTERRIVEPDPDPRRHLASGGDRHQEVAAGKPIALRDRQGRRDHFRRDVGHGGTVHVAHRHGRDEIAVEQGRTGKRQVTAADHARFIRLRQRRRQRRQLMGFLALVAGQGTGESIQQQVLAVLPDVVRKVVVCQRGSKLRQHLRRFFRHHCLLQYKVWLVGLLARGINADLDASRLGHLNTTGRAACRMGRAVLPGVS